MKKLILTLLILAGNISVANGVSSADKKTFYYVDNMIVRAMVNAGEANAVGEYSQKLVSYEACVKDAISESNPANLPFEISAGDVSLNLVSDYRGCVVWTEFVEFDPESEMKNVMMERTLKTKDAQLEIAKLVFTLNPHLSSFSYFYNTSFSPTPGYERVAYKLGQNPASWKSDGLHIHVKVKE